MKNYNHRVSPYLIPIALGLVVTVMPGVWLAHGDIRDEIESAKSGCIFDSRIEWAVVV